MRTVKGTTGAYVSEYSGLNINNIGKAKDKALIENLTYASFDSAPKGWTKVGSVDVVITLFDDKEINESQIATLREMKKTVQAEAQKKITEIEQQIQSLLAIEG